MKVGEIWIEKEVEPDEEPQLLRLLEYNGDDTWTCCLGELEDGLLDDEVDLDDSLPFICSMRGDDIYSDYYRYGVGQ